MPYFDFLPRIIPPPMRGPWGQRFGEAVGGRMDAIAQRFREAVFARFPRLAASDALDAIGRDRLLPRGSGEADDAYAARLENAWALWGGDNTPLSGKGGGAGAHLGMLLAIKTAGIATGPNGATIVQQNGRYAQLDANGELVLGTLMNCVNRVNLLGAIESRAGWTFDGRDNFYSVFGIVFPQNTLVVAARLNEAVEKWKPSKALYAGAWVLQSGSLLGWPAGGRTLGTEPVLGGNVALYIYPPRGHDELLGYSLV